MLVVNVPYAVTQDYSIAVAMLVVLVDKFLLVGLPTLGSELLRLEER